MAHKHKLVGTKKSVNHWLATVYPAVKVFWNETAFPLCRYRWLLKPV